jgi:hypothetical protein
MGTTTTNYGLRKPSGSDAVNPQIDIDNLADDTDVVVYTQVHAIGRGIVAWGNRTTDSTGTISEVGVLRIDNIAVTSGRSYRIWHSAVEYYSNIGNDTVYGRLRANFSGAATTSSTIVGPDIRVNQTATGTSFPESRVGQWLYNSATTGSLSLLLCVGRAQGTGTVKMAISGTQLDLVVEDIGPSAGDSGVDI